jgi:hypothetical protein
LRVAKLMVVDREQPGNLRSFTTRSRRIEVATTGGDDGVQVDPAGLGGVAGQLGWAYVDFDAAITEYAGTACYRKADFGELGVDTAWSNFDGAWAGEVDVLDEAIVELIQKVDVTKGELHRQRGHGRGLLRRDRTEMRTLSDLRQREP